MKRSIVAFALIACSTYSTISMGSSSFALNEVQKTDLFCAGWNQARMERLPEDSGDYSEAMTAVNFFYMKSENDGLNDDDDKSKSALMDKAWKVGYDSYNAKPYSTMPGKCFKDYSKFIQSLPEEKLAE